MNRKARFALFILTGWCFVALAIGRSHIFESASAPVMALTVWILTAVVLFVCWKVQPIHRWAMDISVPWLIALHLSRFVGIYFLILCQRDKLSCVFAKPAGVGDITVAIGASILLIFGMTNRGHRTLVLIWNLLGLLDILFVVVSAFRIGLNDWQGMAPLRSLPLMLLPTFLVPLIIASHILIFVRLRLRSSGGYA